jgi:type II secretory pathway pseudopilin PulG
VELLVGLLVSLIILAGTYSLFQSQQVAFSNQEQINEMNQNIRAAMDRMAREVRLAGYKTSTAVFNGIATAQPTTIRLLADINQDGTILGDTEDVTYSYDVDTLRICRNGVSLPIAENITNLAFLYTLADGSTTSSPGALNTIRKVTISITARTKYPDLSTGQYRTFTLSSDVTPRNLIS